METVELAGRKFQIIANGPIKHDLWIAERVHASGMDGVTMGKDETPEQFVDALLAKLLASGAAMEFLGGMLAPADLDLRKWTPAIALDMATFVEELIAPEDKALVRGLLAQVVVGFFQSGLAYLRTSPTASAALEPSTGADVKREPRRKKIAGQ